MSTTTKIEKNIQASKQLILKLPDGSRAMSKEDLARSVRKGDLVLLDEERISALKASASAWLIMHPTSLFNDTILDWWNQWNEQLESIRKGGTDDA